MTFMNMTRLILSLTVSKFLFGADFDSNPADRGWLILTENPEYILFVNGCQLSISFNLDPRVEPEVYTEGEEERGKTYLSAIAEDEEERLSEVSIMTCSNEELTSLYIGAITNIVTYKKTWQAYKKYKKLRAQKWVNMRRIRTLKRTIGLFNEGTLQIPHVVRRKRRRRWV